MTQDEMMKQMMAMMATMQKMNEELVALKSAPKVEPKAKAEPKEPRKKWDEMDDTEKAEAKKEQTAKALEVPLADRLAKIKSKMEDWKSKVQNPAVKMGKAEKGIGWIATYEITSKAGKQFKYITVHPVSWAENYEQVKADLAGMGYRPTMINWLLRYSIQYTDEKFAELKDYCGKLFKAQKEEPKEEPKVEEPEVEEDPMEVEEQAYEETEQVEEQVEQVEELTDEEVKTKIAENAELLEARDALAKAKAELEELNKQLEAKRNSVSQVLNEYKYTTA